MTEVDLSRLRHALNDFARQMWWIVWEWRLASRCPSCGSPKGLDNPCRYCGDHADD